MKLSQLLQEIGVPHPLVTDSDIQFVTSDHRRCAPGALFVAIRGTQVDGHAFLDDARSRGAVATLGEEAPVDILVKDSRLALSLAAAALHDWPTRFMKVVGVTGTSGKTTTTYLVESILAQAGQKVGVIGTVNFRVAGKVIPSTHTTPGPVELQALLADMRREGCTAVVMEVSSHALKQRRAAGVLFDAVAFSNLTPEHLDYHPDLEDYYQSKKLLFTEQAERSRAKGKSTAFCVNIEDEFGARLAKELRGTGPLTEYGIPADWTVGRFGVRGKIAGHPFQSSLAGRFNASNIQCAASLALTLGIDAQQVAGGIAALAFAPGRMQAVPNDQGLSIWVDYAHKPDALEKVLQNLQDERAAGRLWTIFGCGGDRDRTKRPVMAQIAERLSDFVVVTSDNPRTEDPNAIIQEICQGFKRSDSYRVEADRRQAIISTVQAMRPGDLLIIAGKGHEAYQLVGSQTLPFDDVQVATEALASRLTG